MDRDITQYTEWDVVEQAELLINRCICGNIFRYRPLYRKEYPTLCPKCGRKLYFTQEIHVYEVVDEDGKD